MAKLSKKQWIVAGAAAVVSIGLAGIYLQKQVKKALTYNYKFSRFKVNKISFNQINFDLFYNLTNPSKMKYVIQSITTKVHINNVEIADIANYRQQEIKPESTTEIGVNVEIEPKELAAAVGQSWATMLRNLDKIGNTKITMDLEIKIGYLGQLLSVTVPYKEQFPLKSILPKNLK